MRRILDVFVSILGLVTLTPALMIFMFLIWKEDRGSPLYISKRVGLNGIEFEMVKLRSMVLNADVSGVESTSSNDKRITSTGHLIRKFKLDELMQLWNVLLGDMSLIGPRPNVKRETDMYTFLEKKLLTVKPGITDIASIVFSDEGEILAGKVDPDLSYNQLIRPGKSKLALFHIEHRSFSLDFLVVLLTVISIFSKKHALRLLVHAMEHRNACEKLIEIAARQKPLTKSPPPGSKTIVKFRQKNGELN